MILHNENIGRAEKQSLDLVSVLAEFAGSQEEMKKSKQVKKQTSEDILRDMFIAQLASVGLTQHQIREIVGVDIGRVNRIVKHFKKVKRNG